MCIEVGERVEEFAREFGGDNIGNGREYSVYNICYYMLYERVEEFARVEY